MIILGVDPGLGLTGYGVIEIDRKRKLKLKEAGVIKTSHKDTISARLENIYDNFSELATEYKPEVLVLEKLYSHYKHPVTSILMGHSRGVVCLAAGMFKIKLVNYPSTRIKKSVTGNGHASKVQVQGAIQNLFGLKKKPEPVDVSDALAAALTYVNMELKGI
ncbi:MAG: crossover junction endodeoxyribonuclease RuvC [Candidatus Omnitrophica bacterium]|nr:crossover junction endodeoxyribonuclease RuvC [Candidatus Omnitrophota bacterium]